MITAEFSFCFKYKWKHCNDTAFKIPSWISGHCIAFKSPKNWTSMLHLVNDRFLKASYFMYLYTFHFLIVLSVWKVLQYFCRLSDLVHRENKSAFYCPWPLTGEKVGPVSKFCGYVLVLHPLGFYTAANYYPGRPTFRNEAVSFLLLCMKQSVLHSPSHSYLERACFPQWVRKTNFLRVSYSCPGI